MAPKPKPFLETRSRNLEDIGLAILRRGHAADSVCVMLDHGTHGGSHGHFDKLNIVVYAAGQEWLLDPGRLTYSHKEYKTWVKHTAAHNTVAVGRSSQHATTGKFLWLKTDDAFVACAAESDGAYPGTMLRRYLLLTDTVLLDVFEVECKEKTHIDWFAHAVSKSVAPAGERGAGKEVIAGTEHGYEHLTDARAWNVVAPSSWDFAGDGKRRLRVWFAGLESEQVVACKGIGYSVEQKVPCLIRRVHDQKARFTTAYDLTATGNHITAFRTGNDGELIVTTEKGEQRVRFTPDGVRFELKK